MASAVSSMPSSIQRLTMHPLTLLVPNLALQYALLWTNLKVGKLELSLLHLATVISTVYMRLFLVERDEARRARQMGARTWPILRTGWPLNLDLLVRQARALFHEVALKTTVDAAPECVFSNCVEILSLRVVQWRPHLR